MPQTLADPTGLDDAALDALDARLRQAARTGDHSALSVLGYGEVTTVIGVTDGDDAFAVKGLPTFVDVAEAQRHVRCIERYTAALRERGVNVVPTDARIRPQADGSAVLYLVQPMLPSGAVGPQHFGRLSAPERVAAFARILETLRTAVTPEVAPDGQLSNWAFVGDELLYLDVSTPFLRDAEGASLLDWRFFVDAHPWVLRPIIRAQIPAVVGKYHRLRVLLVDILGNLIKEDMDGLLPALCDESNRRCSFERPITEDEVRRYYADDARTFGFLLTARRLDRFVRVHLLRRPYPVLIPPRFERHPQRGRATADS